MAQSRHNKRRRRRDAPFYDVNGAKCPLSFDKDKSGEPVGPWYEQSMAEWRETDKRRPTANHNKILDPADNTFKIMKTSDGQMCARSRPVESTKYSVSDIERLTERLRRLSDKLAGTIRSNHAQAMAVTEATYAQYERLKNIHDIGLHVGFKPSAKNACNPGDPHNPNPEWERLYGTPRNPKVNGLNPSALELDLNKWYRPFIVNNGRDVYCAADAADMTDRLHPGTYHNLDKLRAVDTDELPRDTTTGAPQPYGALYQDMAFCAQRDRDECVSSESLRLPFGGEAAPSDRCRYNESMMHAEENMCMPRNIPRTRGQRLSRDGYTRAFVKFAKKERADVEKLQHMYANGYGFADRGDLPGDRYTHTRR